MSVSSTSYFSNSVVGIPTIASDVKITEQSETPRFALGTKFERQDGAVFRYVHFGATVSSAGLVLASDVSETGFEPCAITIATSSSYQMADDLNGVYPGMKGSKYIILTKGSVSADDFAGGYLSILNSGSQHGHTYRIKGNTKTGNPSSGNFRAELYSKLLVGYGANDTVAIAGCKYNNIEPASILNSDTVCVGVSIQSSNTTNAYGWVQSKGIVACLNDSTTPLSGYTAYISTGASYGEVGMHVEIETGTIVVPVVGTYLQGGTASNYTFVDLKLD